MTSTGCHALFLWKEELKVAGILSFLMVVLPLVAFKDIKTKKVFRGCSVGKCGAKNY